MRTLASAMLAAAGIGTAAGVGLVVQPRDPPAPVVAAHPATAAPVAAPGGRPTVIAAVRRGRHKPPKPHHGRRHDRGKHTGKARSGR